MHSSIPSPVFLFAIALGVVLMVLRLLRNRSLREKYAALWVVVGLGALVLIIWPRLLDGVASLLGFQVPANLLFLLGLLFVMAVLLHLSLEISRLEDETRVLAEECAIQRLEASRLEARVRALEEGTSRAGVAPGAVGVNPETAIEDVLPTRTAVPRTGSSRSATD